MKVHTHRGPRMFYFDGMTALDLKTGLVAADEKLGGVAALIVRQNGRTLDDNEIVDTRMDAVLSPKYVLHGPDVHYPTSDELIKPGDLLQSSASRLAEWVLTQDQVPYEVHMAALEAQDGVKQWTAARR